MTSVTEEMIEALKPCPFCGGAPEMQPWHGGVPTKVLISCSQGEYGDDYGGCSVSPMVTGETPAEAIAAWNRRTPPEAISNRDDTERGEAVAYGEEIGGAIVSVRLDKSRHCSVPLYLHPLEAALSASPAAQTSNLQKMQNAEGWESALHGALISRIMPETRDMTDAEAQALGTDLLGLIRTYAPSAPQPTEPVAHPTPAEAAAQLREYARKQVLAGKTMPGDNIFEDAANLIDRLASPVAQQRDDGWFDMSIAPKNGTRIVVQMPDGPGEEYWYETPAGWRYAVLSPERKDQSNG